MNSSSSSIRKFNNLGHLQGYILVSSRCGFKRYYEKKILMVHFVCSQKLNVQPLTCVHCVLTSPILFWCSLRHTEWIGRNKRFPRNTEHSDSTRRIRVSMPKQTEVSFSTHCLPMNIIWGNAGKPTLSALSKWRFLCISPIR